MSRSGGGGRRARARAPERTPERAKGRRPRIRWRRVARNGLLAALLVLLVLPAAALLVFRVVPPPVTPLMLIRLVQGEGLAREWVALDDLPAHVPAAVLAAEDNAFCQHGGIDWRALRQAIDEYRAGGRLRGASTVSMQTAKNLFLWPGRDWVRKGLEAWLTLLVEALWPKHRILEVYLNIAEWGPGVYGIGAAARHHFDKPATALTTAEAARLAVVLPNPRERSAARPTPRLARLARTVAARIPQIAPLLDCY